jgi:hypothetical protein
LSKIDDYLADNLSRVRLSDLRRVVNDKAAEPSCKLGRHSQISP